MECRVQDRFPHRDQYALGFLSAQTADTATFCVFPKINSMLMALHG